MSNIRELRFQPSYEDNSFITEKHHFSCIDSSFLHCGSLDTSTNECGDQPNLGENKIRDCKDDVIDNDSCNQLESNQTGSGKIALRRLQYLDAAVFPLAGSKIRQESQATQTSDNSFKLADYLLEPNIREFNATLETLQRLKSKWFAATQSNFIFDQNTLSPAQLAFYKTMTPFKRVVDFSANSIFSVESYRKKQGYPSTESGYNWQTKKPMRRSMYCELQNQMRKSTYGAKSQRNNIQSPRSYNMPAIKDSGKAKKDMEIVDWIDRSAKDKPRSRQQKRSKKVTRLKLRSPDECDMVLHEEIYHRCPRVVNVYSTDSKQLATTYVSQNRSIHLWFITSGMWIANLISFVTRILLGR